MPENKKDLPHISGDVEADEKRRQMDILIRSRTSETPEQKRTYERFYETLMFRTSEDQECFDLLPLSNTEKMNMVQEMKEAGELGSEINLVE